MKLRETKLLPGKAGMNLMKCFKWLGVIVLAALAYTSSNPEKAIYIVGEWILLFMPIPKD